MKYYPLREHPVEHSSFPVAQLTLREPGFRHVYYGTTYCSTDNDLYHIQEYLTVWLWKSAVLLFNFHLPGPQRTQCVADIPGRYTEYRWIYTTNSDLPWRKVWVLPNDQLKWRRLKTHWEGPYRWPTTGSTFMKYSPRNVKCILLMWFPTMWNPTFYLTVRCDN